MATIKIYRAAYVLGSDEDAEIRFSKWVSADGIDEVFGGLPSATPSQGLPPESVLVEPLLLGWEEKELDTEPV